MKMGMKNSQVPPTGRYHPPLKGGDKYPLYKHENNDFETHFKLL